MRSESEIIWLRPRGAPSPGAQWSDPRAFAVRVALEDGASWRGWPIANPQVEQPLTWPKFAWEETAAPNVARCAPIDEKPCRYPAGPHTEPRMTTTPTDAPRYWSGREPAVVIIYANALRPGAFRWRGTRCGRLLDDQDQPIGTYHRYVSGDGWSVQTKPYGGFAHPHEVETHHRCGDATCAGCADTEPTAPAPEKEPRDEQAQGE